ncbi:MAG: N-acetylmuramoyl-L-alanine amidase [Planctomycetota bacterium]|jgi:N-acetyl-anhydromuramyl-L-alanine amidase AmpD
MKRSGLILFLVFGACAAPPPPARPGDPLRRKGDEIVICGQMFHTGAPVVLWMDPGGYDAYRPHRHLDESKEAPSRGKGARRYGTFRKGLPEGVDTRVHGRGWDLSDLRKVVRQFVIHYDAAGTSERCFEILQDVRGLSCQFLLDVDGTIYQTLDVKERAWHAGKANDVSVGVEIANLGAYPDKERVGAGAVEGTIQGTTLHQQPFTDEQYESLARLSAALVRVLPRIRPVFPRDAEGRVVPAVLPDNGRDFAGILGHYHLTRAKVDPGPAFDWDRLAARMKELE